MKYSILASLLVSLACAAPSPVVTPVAELEKRQSSNVNVNGVGIRSASAARVRQSFTASGVVPTLIPTETFCTAPASPLEQHRYTFLVYREPAGYSPNILGAQVRLAFDLLGYTRAGGLGQPIAGNFFNQSLTNGIVPS
ncbi:hypothetical protein CLAFUW4_12895 [Fulvia fulva]|uniref:Uncharacterized protein n=1 Tax=Passalora fulva TaxID=5499 RepID=A0A9Q8PK08_PASFU|nr:uncharacterized protein CLAFUR5_12761 [Fulvia fulva]KAK4612348.1 hypothetical protein CLAFUR4_12899 [Fulvia fulva]KAK4613133.1 hypothetical protein CLAFUR0_12905 [Fulvia fulva]UJO23878.1 hypothetical protein CLAFUR5_12761 [Fulvia fulva]WPV20980.1 hypothetical protein CLAFUW4_12895 [Fulvia fulva]WPV35792.1 hypothetical protein CLAFUW7_12902 [Fulvia fulva]